MQRLLSIIGNRQQNAIVHRRNRWAEIVALLDSPHQHHRPRVKHADPERRVNHQLTLAQFVADGPAIRAAVARAPENTLDRPRYEFYAFDDYAASPVERLAQNHRLLTALRREAAPPFLARAADWLLGGPGMRRRR